ncbi:MAG: DUF1080 domain-containing protein [Isosphaeraceae bacterium]|nr:DUF1080 domain-containing protein [Isosphaeraceae bacterium]
MRLLDTRRVRILTVCLVATGAAAVAALDERSALEREPAGWVDLLAEGGAELRGWTRVTIPPGGTPRPKSPWSYDPATGVLKCDGRNLHEWLRHDTPRGDAIYHVEWRFVPVVEGKKAYNSGIYVRNSADGAIWHQAQVGGGPAAFLFGETPVSGTKRRINLAKSATTKRVEPAGEWNVFEVECRGKEVVLWCNGAEACRWSDCEVSQGHVGLEAEGYEIEFRKVLLKPLAP